MNVPGLFLQDERGKRYPARRPLACKLIGKGQRVSLMRRACNYYCYGECSPSAVNAVMYHEQHLLALRPEGVCIKPDLTRVLEQRDKPLQTIVAQIKQANTPDLGRGVRYLSSAAQKSCPSQRKYRKPLADTGREALAQRLYALVDSLSPDNQLSEINARKLVDQYDARLVERALERVGRDQRIYNPAGFVITYLRSAAKARCVYNSTDCWG